MRSSAIGRSSASRRRRSSITRAPGSRPSARAASSGATDLVDLEDPRGRAQAAGLHLPAEAEQAPGLAVDRRLRDERAAAADPVEQPLVDEPPHALARGHPADPEALAELGLRRQRVPRPEPRDVRAQRLLDRQVPGHGSPGHGAVPTSSEGERPPPGRFARSDVDVTTRVGRRARRGRPPRAPRGEDVGQVRPSPGRAAVARGTGCAARSRRRRRPGGAGRPARARRRARSPPPRSRTSASGSGRS